MPVRRRRARSRASRRVATVPLCPRNRKVADLISSRSDVPRFGDHLDLTERRVLVDEHEEARQLIDVVQGAGQRGAKSKRKPSTCMHSTQ